MDLACSPNSSVGTFLQQRPCHRYIVHSCMFSLLGTRHACRARCDVPVVYGIVPTKLAKIRNHVIFGLLHEGNAKMTTPTTLTDAELRVCHENCKIELKRWLDCTSGQNLLELARGNASLRKMFSGPCKAEQQAYNDCYLIEQVSFLSYLSKKQGTDTVEQEMMKEAKKQSSCQ